MSSFLLLGGLGAVLERSWAVLGLSWGSPGALLVNLGVVLGRLGAAGGGKNVDSPYVFQRFLAKSMF